MLQVLLTESHPETGTLDSGIIDDKALNLLVVQQIAVARTDVGVGEILVNLQRLCLYPLAVLPVESLLSNLADVNLWVEVGGESLMVVASVAVHDIKIVNLLEVMLGSIGGIDARYTWVETTTEDGCEACLLEALTISPLPRILEVCLVLGFVVGGVKIAASASQTSVHNRQVLIGQGKVDDQLGLVVIEQCLQLLYIVGIYLSSLDVELVACLMDVLYNLVALCLATRCNHKLCKHVNILCYLECCHRCDATSANH